MQAWQLVSILKDAHESAPIVIVDDDNNELEIAYIEVNKVATADDVGTSTKCIVRITASEQVYKEQLPA